MSRSSRRRAAAARGAQDLSPRETKKIRETLLEVIRQKEQGAPGNPAETTTCASEVERIHLDIILRFISLRCRDTRRCNRGRCRRSGTCAERAQTLRTMGPDRGRKAPIPPRRARFRQENLLERDQGA
jgi:hypothetical protein